MHACMHIIYLEEQQILHEMQVQAAHLERLHMHNSVVIIIIPMIIMIVCMDIIHVLYMHAQCFRRWPDKTASLS